MTTSESKKEQQTTTDTNKSGGGGGANKMIKKEISRLNPDDKTTNFMDYIVRYYRYSDKRDVFAAEAPPLVM